MKENGGQAKWIWFDLLSPPEHLAYIPKTKRWGVYTKKECLDLGTIKWNCGWRRYTFYPFPDTNFEEDCLRDIANFVEEQMRLRKAEGKK